MTNLIENILRVIFSAEIPTAAFISVWALVLAAAIFFLVKLVAFL